MWCCRSKIHITPIYVWHCRAPGATSWWYWRPPSSSWRSSSCSALTMWLKSPTLRSTWLRVTASGPLTWRSGAGETATCQSLETRCVQALWNTLRRPFEQQSQQRQSASKILLWPVLPRMWAFIAVPVHWWRAPATSWAREPGRRSIAPSAWFAWTTLPPWVTTPTWGTTPPSGWWPTPACSGWCEGSTSSSSTWTTTRPSSSGGPRTKSGRRARARCTGWSRRSAPCTATCRASPSRPTRCGGSTTSFRARRGETGELRAKPRPQNQMSYTYLICL